MPSRLNVLLMLSIAYSTSFAGSCERWEYAKLKDESKQELSAEYCRAVAHAIANAKMAQNARDTFRKVLDSGNHDRALQINQEAHQISMDQVSCMKQAEDVESMLMKRFKAKPPSKCQKDYETAIPPSKS